MSKKARMSALASLVFLAVVGGAAYVTTRVAPANAEASQPVVQNVTLPAGQKLKETAWHCWSGGSCELWYLTKPRKQGEAPESYVFSNADGTRKYLIREQ